MRAFRLALAFLTVLPVGPEASAEELRGHFSASRAYFPLVGLFLGALMAGLDALLKIMLPPMLTAALLLVALILATRALHMEGFLDACDGLLGGQTPERRLEIMRDPHVGAFAVVGGVCLVLAKWAALVAMSPPLRLPTLLLFPCLSRWGMTLVIGLFPYARDQGLGVAFDPGRGRWQLAAAGGTALAAGALLASGLGLALLVAATGVAWLLGLWMRRLLGGLTGDTYGAINELVEVIVLVLAVALSGTGGLLFAGPVLG